MSSWPILSLVTFLPLVGAIFCLVVNGPKEAVDRNCRSAALITSLVTFLISLLLWIHFDPTKAGFQFEEKLAWLPSSTSATTWASTASRCSSCCCRPC